MTQQDIDAYLQSLPGAWIDYPYGPDVVVYKVGKASEESEKMFALVVEGSVPLRVSLRCDPQLAVLLREKYESIQPGYNLNKKYWNTIICTGQVGDEELKDLARLSHRLASE